ncbi:hypothetical protein XANCAGTX0491_005944 [Xanthoria calcicola]
MLTQQPFNPSPSPASIAFSETWHLLGPFQIGTREATWGADPLERIGGFRSLSYSESDRYRSSLAVNGTVGWSTLTVESSWTSSPGNAKADLLVRFDNTDWESLQSVYGWAALQYQGWARGKITVEGNQQRTVVFYTDQVLEFWIDDEHHFGGDFYGYRRAPLVLHLDPGNHQIDIRIIRDVRAMGGVGEPTVRIELEAEISGGGLKLVEGTVLLPDMVDGRLVSSLGSVNLRNEEHHWIDVLSLEAVNVGFTVAMKESPPFRLAPGQSRPLSFDIALAYDAAAEVVFEITYKVEHSSGVFRTSQVRQAVHLRKAEEPQKITYLHPGGTVSYAILRPPSAKALRYACRNASLAVVIGLHGAGVETDSDLVRQTFKDAPDLKAWVLFPSGVTTWSGDDWHRWGVADTEAAIAAIPEWIKTVGWKGPNVDINRRLVIGHSNGGQGTWYALTHTPDKIVGATPVSGYSSIQAYVPYFFWHEADPGVNAILQSALADYRHELLLPNGCGIPIHQQHGSLDDNVPPFHSRRLSQIQSQIDCPSEYVELPGKGHWFEGVMTTQTLLEFYGKVLGDRPAPASLSSSFDIVVANPGTMGSKGGIIVDQLTTPGRPGRIKAEHDVKQSIWHLKTSNIQRLHFSAAAARDWTRSKLVVDGKKLELLRDVPLSGQWLVHRPNESWEVSCDSLWRNRQRHGRQLGALDAMLDTSGRYVLLTSRETLSLAVQVSRNFFQYFGSDAEIIGLDQANSAEAGNRVILSLGFAGLMPATADRHDTIFVDEEKGLCVRGSNGRLAVYAFREGLGAIFLRPGTNGSLELVIWAFDLLGLRFAARMVPVLTGVGQPDFIVVGQECAWKGAAGVVALGYLDNSWNVAESSAIL